MRSAGRHLAPECKSATAKPRKKGRVRRGGSPSSRSVEQSREENLRGPTYHRLGNQPNGSRRGPRAARGTLEGRAKIEREKERKGIAHRSAGASATNYADLCPHCPLSPSSRTSAFVYVRCDALLCSLFLSLSRSEFGPSDDSATTTSRNCRCPCGAEQDGSSLIFLSFSLASTAFLLVDKPNERWLRCNCCIAPMRSDASRGRGCRGPARRPTRVSSRSRLSRRL